MKELEGVNKKIYENLEMILQKLDDRLDLKLYAIVLDANKDWKKAVRVKGVLSNLRDQDIEIIQEGLDDPVEVFRNLGLTYGNLDYDVKQLLDNIDNIISDSNLHSIGQLSDYTLNEEQSVIEIDEERSFGQYSNNGAIFYSNTFNFEIEEQHFTVKYILSIEYTDFVTRSIFIERPQLSFLRMVLDYYFKDFYEFSNEEELFVNEHLEIETKYKENNSQFLQRMARLFFGKIQSFIRNELDLSAVSSEVIELTETEKNQYYINNLLEKIDGVSTRTYEGESPFGCMLLLSSSLLNDNKLIKYSIRFQNQQPIYLEDARRIRKLLELTNNERDLYLIADDTAIYGVGEIDWGQLENNLLFKLEFKGLSRYDLSLVTTEKRDNTDARVVEEVESKIFKVTQNLEIVPHKLTGISFKNPGIGSGGFTTELFERVMKAQFKELDPPITDKGIEKLRLIIQKSTEQQSGTMVVITERVTAENELKKLGKQSTLIHPTEISPALIKHLTSIDGAIYFDITGACHAIGVILDGLAQEHLGDASRGARFHSAHRYLEKLRTAKKGCVIAIISEDGMVNLIPEQANEASVRQLVRMMINYITDSDEINEENLQDYNTRLLEIESETIIDHHYFFGIAAAFLKKNYFKKAASYYEKGLKVSGRFILEYNRVLSSSLIRLGFNETDKIIKLQAFKDALEQVKIIFKMASDSEINHHDYNHRALALHNIGRWSKEKDRAKYYKDSLSDFTKALEMKKGNKSILFRNRGFLYAEMENFPAALDDFIGSEIELSDEETLKLVERLIKQDVSLFLHALTYYSEKKNNKEGESEGLAELFEEYGANIAEDHPEVAAALEQFGIKQPKQEDD
ncbi:diadenylate cyclase [Paenibacillus sp. NPDC057934]|uniref:diadenylate cyclase n=1 Tax=Paenibacillus sp. NPDC057934 TaxID=3346282 RepID=UPI0036D78CF7